MNQPAQEPPKVRLFDLLAQMEDVVEGLLQMTVDELDDLKEATKEKVDGYKTILDTYDVYISRYKKEIDDLASIKKSLETKQKNLREWIALQMDQFKYERLPGEKYKVSLRKTKSYQLKQEHAECGPVHYAQYQDFIKRTYAWEKKKILDDIKANGDKSAFIKWVDPVTKPSVTFTLNKEISK